ncbi:MAG: acylphosphatase [Xanthomonadales bacterium]|nr:acylphosphatase [Xanthomonadales bacterium]NIX11753.1 acylphosphatase [Xanthomonadales bacterium]
MEGRVQGVWFRESTRQQARRYGITGYAVNRPDGSVEVLACGAPESLTALRSWLRTGPPLAEVSEVVELAAEVECPAGFRTG